MKPEQPITKHAQESIDQMNPNQVPELHSLNAARNVISKALNFSQIKHHWSKQCMEKEK